MNKPTKIIIALIVIALVVWGIIVSVTDNQNRDRIKVGVITPLTGDSAWYGESTVAGFQLAKEKLAEKGIEIEVISEDGKVASKPALNAAQKLVNVNDVDAIYSDFNPAAISVSSFLADKDIIHIYDAAPVSPLEESNNIYKTYLDFYASCNAAAKRLKKRGVEKPGVLKMNIEFGELCLKGIKSVYPNPIVESYNQGNTEFLSHLTKLRAEDVDSIINISLTQETFSSLKARAQLNMRDIPFIATADSLPENLVQKNVTLMDNVIAFGLPQASEEFVDLLRSKYPRRVNNLYKPVSAMAYLHGMQLGRAFDTCSGKLACVRSELNNAPPFSEIGFQGFKNRVAKFDPYFTEWNGSEFVELKD